MINELLYEAKLHSVICFAVSEKQSPSSDCADMQAVLQLHNKVRFSSDEMPIYLSNSIIN